jgi:2-polyprenyl-3-methyl-5-hydroxy-6-metoxy-1,4-benzoquinol methylase
MIAIAHERQAAAGVTNVMFRIAPADEPQGPPASFDAVLALNLLHLVQDRADLYRTIRTTLKPRGLFISKTACIQEMNVMIRAAIPLARAIGKAPWVAAFDARTLEAEIAAAGFTIEESARHGSKRTDPRIYIVARAP